MATHKTRNSQHIMRLKAVVQTLKTSFAKNRGTLTANDAPHLHGSPEEGVQTFHQSAKSESHSL